MNILFLTSWYPIKEKPAFGIFIREHAWAVKSTQHDVRVLAIIACKSKKIFKTSIFKYTDDFNVVTYEVRIQSIFYKFIHYITPIQKQLALKIYGKHIEPDFKLDILHSHVVFPAGVIGDSFSKEVGCKHIITEHWSKIESLLKRPLIATRTIDAYKRATYILPVSSFLKNSLVKLFPYIETSKFKIIPNVVNSEIYNYRPIGTHEKEIRFCAIAAWGTKNIPDKMPELFIEALSKLQQHTDKHFKLTMIGSGNQVEELTELCKSYDLDAVFLGYQSKQNIAKTLQETDYFLHASTVETFGIVVVEALLTGTPVICSSVGALPEVVNDSNGILCENTITDWTKAIEQAIEKKFDRKKIAMEMGTKFSYQKIGDLLSDTYIKTQLIDL